MSEAGRFAGFSSGKNSRVRTSVAVLAAALWVATSLADAASQANPASASREKTEEEVIVEGKRIELERRVYDFVSGVTHRGYMTESLARWNKPICPLVAGIPSAQGEFILSQVSKAAKAAGAPIAGRKCKPNFHVVLTYDPDELMRLWRKRAPRLFGAASPTEVRRVMGQARPVRVWYNAWEKCGDGEQGGVSTGANLSDAWSFMGDCQIKDTRLQWNYVVPILSVVVIVDIDDIKGVKIGPLADYIAMVGLTKVDFYADLRDAPTILRLFPVSTDVAPQGMSEWDRAFLKGLYTTSQLSRFQRSEIARQMVSGFVAH
jgi:hypothetical protein